MGRILWGPAGAMAFAGEIVEDELRHGREVLRGAL